MSLQVKKATMSNAAAIHSLVNRFAKKDDMLPRSLNDIYENIRDFFVCIDEEELVAAASLHIVWEDLAEIRSIAVIRKYQGQGVGRKLVKQCLKEAKRLGITKVFALTYHPEYFKRLGFEGVDKNDLPHKIWGDCLNCHKFPDCDEVGVMIKLE